MKLDINARLCSSRYTLHSLYVDFHLFPLFKQFRTLRAIKWQKGATLLIFLARVRHTASHLSFPQRTNHPVASTSTLFPWSPSRRASSRELPAREDRLPGTLPLTFTKRNACCVAEKEIGAAGIATAS